MKTTSHQATKPKKEQLQIFVDEIDVSKSVIPRLIAELYDNKRRLRSIDDLQLSVASARDDQAVDYQEELAKHEIERIQAELHDKTKLLSDLIQGGKKLLASLPAESPLVFEAEERLMEAVILIKRINVSLDDKKTAIKFSKPQSSDRTISNSEVRASLSLALHEATKSIKTPIINDAEIVKRIELVASNAENRACVRFIMACSLAKIDQPGVDIRKPYTEIGGDDSFSGRTYDELYITEFISNNELPCNSTTAFLAPPFVILTLC